MTKEIGKDAQELDKPIPAISSLQGNPTESVTSTYYTAYYQQRSNSNPPQQSTTERPVASTNFNYLAELYWKFPTVHQNICAFPLHSSNAVILHAARNKNEKLRHDLQKEPKPSKHLLAKKKEDPNPNKPGKRNSVKTLAPNRRRTVNRATVGPRGKSINPGKRPTLKDQQGQNNDPVTALNHFRQSKGFTGSAEAKSSRNSVRQISKSGNSAQGDQVVVADADDILDAIRDQEDLEKNSKESSKCFTKNCLKGCTCSSLERAITSNRCVFVVFIICIAVLACLCIVAIVYPIVKVLLMYENETS